MPIAGIAGDQQAALFGQACFVAGMTKNTYGTGSFVLMNVGEVCPPPVEGLLTTVAWTIPGAMAAGRPAPRTHSKVPCSSPAPPSSGSGTDSGIIDEAAEIGPLAQSCDDTDGVYVVPAFTGLGSPWWDPYARGTIVGITRGTGRSQLARAVVESMAYQVRDVVDAMSAASGRVVTELRVDGGASVMDLLLQFQADQIGVSVTRPSIQETTALGSAYLAGLAEGVWSTTDEVAANWAVDASFTPEFDRSEADARHQRWLDAVTRSRGWVPAA